ncbi:MAG: multidrug DMT transporter permease [Escherichia coli]|nr:MAG: multidrug DMT transporter permease [Escherichia coli]
MWVLFAFGSALFAGLTSVLAKTGVKTTDSDVATAIRTCVVFVFSWLMVFVVGSQNSITDIDLHTWIFLVLSGISTGASWLCYYKALKMGDINKVVVIDKSSTVISMIFAIVFLGEHFTFVTVLCIAAIAFGTFLMVYKKSQKSTKNKSWILWATLSAVFAALTSVLGKVGVQNIDSNLGTAIRTFIVLIMSFLIVFIKQKQSYIKSVPKKELLFLCLSGIATGASWLCYYKALKDGLVSVVVPIDKLSILVTVVFSYFIFKEKLSKKSLFGLALIVVGTIGVIF